MRHIGEIMDIKKFLKQNICIFDNVSDAEIEQLLEFGGVFQKEYDSNETIQDKNHYDKIGIILSGKASVRSGIDGVIINKLKENDFFGVAVLFDSPKHLTIVKADSKCKVLILTKDFVLHCITKNYQISLNYIRFLSKKINFLNQKINSYTAKSAENKLYVYLTQIPHDGNCIELNTEMTTIAKMIGIGRATLYRAFDKLEASGLITRDGKNIFLNEV